MVTIFRCLSGVGSNKKAVINEIRIICNPTEKFLTVAYKAPHMK